MYEQEIRAEYARNRLAQLHRGWHERTVSRRRVRRSLGLLFIRVGQRLEPEPTLRRGRLSVRA
jgi:hypothetical protein